MENPHIVIFDGLCNFCNGSVNFIIKRDPEGLFRFAPIQSEVAQTLMAEHGVNELSIDTFVLIKNNTCYVYSNAALEISKDLTGYWSLFNFFRIVPAVIRDMIYRAFARNRYRLFGKRDMCMIPSAEIRSRFISVESEAS